MTDHINPADRPVDDRTPGNLELPTPMHVNWRPDEVDFYVTRMQADRRGRGPRCYGRSSNNLADYALGLVDEVTEVPGDQYDLDACERTYAMAPPSLRLRMAPGIAWQRMRFKLAQERRAEEAEADLRRRAERLAKHGVFQPTTQEHP